MTLTVGSLCSGYGGIELALDSVLDCDLSWFAEFEDAPAKVMAHHHPGVPNLRDLTKIDWTSVAPVDVLTAGFPCQPFSHAGKRLGANDERHLWPHIAQAVAILRPSLVLLENVRGLLSAQGEPDPEWVADLADRAARWQAVIYHVIEPKLRKARRRGQFDRIARLEADAVRLIEQRRVAMDTVRRARGRLVRAIGVVVRDLANLGYDCRWYGLRAADVGAAHGRFRVFLFATPADAEHNGWSASTLGRGVGPSQGERGVLQPQGPPSDPLTLLPTPQTSDTNGPGEHGTGGPDLRTAVSLLPTPRATDGTKGGPNQRGSSGDLMLPSAVTLLPTPTTQPSTGNGHARNLGKEARLLPTPSVADGMGGHLTRSGDRSNELLLPGVAKAHQQAWGQYAAAIARAEQAIGRPAPPPTEPGPNGTPRLSARFVEFLMMLPEGWVTDIDGLTRNELLKMLGNGVVPAQCAAALRAFLWDAYGIGVAA